MKKIITFLFLALAFGSCMFLNRPKTTGYLDPVYRNVSYRNICVMANMDDLVFRYLIEDKIRNYFIREGISSLRGSVILPPTRDWDQDKQKEILQRNKCDAILVITFLNKYSYTQYIPATTEVSTTTREKESKSNKHSKRVNNKGKVKETTTTTTTTGESYKTIEKASFRVELYDVRTGDCVWIGTSRKEMDDYLLDRANYKNSIDDFCSDIVRYLILHGIVAI